MKSEQDKGGERVVTKELQQHAYELTEHWLTRGRNLMFKMGPLADDHRQAAHSRVQSDLHTFDTTKSSLSSWVYGRVKWAIKDASRADGAGLIGTARGQSMPVNVVRTAGVGRLGEGDAITDYAPDKAPGRDIAAGVIGSDLEPIFDAETVMESAEELNEDAASGQQDYENENKQIPAAARRYRRERRIHVFNEHYNEEEKFVAFAAAKGWTAEQANAYLDDPENRAEFIRSNRPNAPRSFDTFTDGDFVPYKDRVPANAESVTRRKSNPFSKRLLALCSGLCESVLGRDDAAAVNQLQQDLLLDNMIGRDKFPREFRNYAISEWLKALPRLLHLREQVQANRSAGSDHSE